MLRPHIPHWKVRYDTTWKLHDSGASLSDRGWCMTYEEKCKSARSMHAFCEIIRGVISEEMSFLIFPHMVSCKQKQTKCKKKINKKVNILKKKKKNNNNKKFMEIWWIDTFKQCLELIRVDGFRENRYHWGKDDEWTAEARETTVASLCSSTKQN